LRHILEKSIVVFEELSKVEGFDGLSSLSFGVYLIVDFLDLIKFSRKLIVWSVFCWYKCKGRL
jgi:hypothetical protein